MVITIGTPTPVAAPYRAVAMARASAKKVDERLDTDNVDDAGDPQAFHGAWLHRPRPENTVGKEPAAQHEGLPPNARIRVKTALNFFYNLFAITHHAPKFGYCMNAPAMPKP